MEYSKSFFEKKFEQWSLEEGNIWRFWRNSQKNRMNIMASELKHLFALYETQRIEVCEVGVATADFTAMYYKPDRMHVIGIDLSENAIKICENKYKNDNNISFRQGDILEIKEEHRFDIVICMDTLHYYAKEKIETAVNNIIKMKKEKGYAFLSVPLSVEDEGGGNILLIWLLGR